MTNNITYTWRTTKNEDGTFTGVVYKNLALETPINGRYVLTGVEARYKRSTRVKAKSAAIKGVRYYKQQLLIKAA